MNTPTHKQTRQLNRQRIHHRAPSALLMLLLAACGGGGGGGSGGPPAVPFVNTLTQGGTLSLLAGNVGGSGAADAVGVEARFNTPIGVAMDGAGNVYVSDTLNHTIRKITATGVVTTLIGHDGLATFQSGALPGAVQLPKGITLADNKLYVLTNNGIVVLTPNPKP